MSIAILPREIWKIEKIIINQGFLLVSVNSTIAWFQRDFNFVDLKFLVVEIRNILISFYQLACQIWKIDAALEKTGV